jgi:uncharacterized NAD(P)/FAD-binding protein YdhS
MPTIAIIGAGFTGSMIAVHLLRQREYRPGAILIEKRPRFGRGLAYSTDNWCHLLNVPAGKMSAFPAEPAHFLAWVNSPEAGADRQYDAASFVPRRLYGDYLASLLDAAAQANPSRFERVTAQVIDLVPATDGVDVHLANRPMIRADRAVMALGNFPPLPPIKNASELTASGRYIPDPWQAQALERIPPDASIVLIGAGLTTVDIALALIRGGHRGAMRAISRHGLLPRRHLPPGPVVAPFELDDLLFSARGMLRTIRRRITDESPDNWQGVIDALRPVIQEAWRRAPIAERKRFVRHLQARWDVHRHRLAPEIATQIDQAVEGGQLQFHAGRVIECGGIADGISVHMRPRGHSEIVTLAAEYVINCTGPASDYRRIDDSLVRNLLKRGLVRPDPLGLGLETDRELHLLDSDGQPSDRLFAAGPMTKGEAWEITAVPDLRTQAAALADRLAAI